MADDRILAAVGYDDGEPVSCAAAIRSGSTVGIYAVGTIERARRRGYGRAVTSAAIDAGRSAWAGTVAVLQSSELGLRVFNRVLSGGAGSCALGSKRSSILRTRLSFGWLSMP